MRANRRLVSLLVLVVGGLSIYTFYYKDPSWFRDNNASSNKLESNYHAKKETRNSDIGTSLDIGQQKTEINLDPKSSNVTSSYDQEKGIESSCAPSGCEFGGVLIEVIDKSSNIGVPEFTVALKSGNDSREFIRDLGDKLEINSGFFELKEVPSGEWTFFISAEGYLDTEGLSLTIKNDQVIKRSEYLTPSGELRVSVHDVLTQEPIQGARIYLDNSPARGHPEYLLFHTKGESDTEGTLYFDKLPLGDMNVRVVTNGFASSTQVVTVKDKSRLTFELAKESIIEGRLVSSDGVTGIKGFIDVTSSLSPGSSVTRPTKDDGSFTLENLVVAKYQIAGRSEGGRSNRLSVVIDSPGQRENIILETIQGTTLLGSINGLLDNERTGAMILVYTQKENGRLHSETELADEKSYQIGGLPSGEVTVMLQTPLRRVTKSAVLGPRERQRLDFNLSNEGEIYGMVSRAGRPIPDQRIRATPVNDEGQHGIGRTDNSGNYRIKGLSYGPHTVKILGGPARQIDVVGAMNIDIELFEGFVTGKIFDQSDNSALSDVRVQASTGGRIVSEAVTDSYGHYQLAGLESKAYSVSFFKSGYDLLQKTVVVEEGSDEQNISLSKTSGIQLVVSFPDGESSPSQVILGARSNDTDSSSSILLQLDDNGATDIPKGLKNYDLTISWPGYKSKSIARWDGNPIHATLMK